MKDKLIIIVGMIIMGGMLGVSFGSAINSWGHTHEPTGVQVGDRICLEYGVLHYADQFGGDDHMDSAFCGDVVIVSEEPEDLPPLQ